MPSLPTIIATLALVYLSTFAYRFLRNVLDARQTGFHYITLPWDPENLLWMLTSTKLRPYLRSWLPKTLYGRVNLTIQGYEHHEKMRPFNEYHGPGSNDSKSFMLVTCGTCEVWTCDPEIANEVLSLSLIHI